MSNAGIMIRKPIRQLTIAEWRRVLDVNLTAAFLLAKAAERPLRQTKGAFVSIASTRAANVGAEHRGLFGDARAALSR